MQITLM